MKNKIALFFATWFYTGLIPPPKFMKGMAGTYGSFFTIPLCYMLLLPVSEIPRRCDIGIYWSTMLFIFCLGWWCVPIAEKLLAAKPDWKGKIKTHDQNQIVIDEVLGMLVTCYPLMFLGVNHLWLVVLIGFGLFRFFDIVKVFPTKYFDNMQNAFGVMLDDFMAGVYSANVLLLIAWYFKL